MDFDDILETLTPMMHANLGPETIILTRASGLTAAKGASSPKTLVLAVDAHAGDASLTLTLPNASPVRGRLEKGSSLTIAGHAYLTQEEVVLPPQGVDSTSIGPVAVLPVLAADAPAGTTAVLAGPQFTWTDGLVIRVGRNGGEPDLDALMHMEVSLPHITAPTIPRKGDGFYRPKDGARGEISKIPVVFGGSWDIEVGVE